MTSRDFLLGLKICYPTPKSDHAFAQKRYLVLFWLFRALSAQDTISLSLPVVIENRGWSNMDGDETTEGVDNTVLVNEWTMFLAHASSIPIA